jgi:hypothetical protein
MAKMARAVWKEAAEAVRNRVEKWPYDELVVTGHSLGAGVACLITIMLHHEKDLLPPNIKVRCLAYAPPPVFHPLDVAKVAQTNITAYVHGRDCVPSLSIHNIRRLFTLLNDLDDANKHLYCWQKLELFFGVHTPKRLLETVERSHAKPLSPVKGAPAFVIPAHVVVWLREDGKGGFLPVFCDALKFGEWGIEVGPNLITDHFPPKYECAFDWLLNEKR